MLTINGLVGSNIVTDENDAHTESASEKMTFKFKLKVNENLVIMPSICPVVFKVRCGVGVRNDQIIELVKEILQLTFGRKADNVKNMYFSFLGNPESNLQRHLYAGDTCLSMSVLPTCEVETTAYPRREYRNGRCLNSTPFFLTETADRKFELLQRFK